MLRTTISIPKGFMSISNTKKPIYSLGRYLQSMSISSLTDTENEMKPPKMPEEWECCGNGCDNCVWEEYFRKQAEYRTWKNEQANLDSKASIPPVSSSSANKIVVHDDDLPNNVR